MCQASIKKKWTRFMPGKHIRFATYLSIPIIWPPPGIQLKRKRKCCRHEGWFAIMLIRNRIPRVMRRLSPTHRTADSPFFHVNSFYIEVADVVRCDRQWRPPINVIMIMQRKQRQYHRRTRNLLLAICSAHSTCSKRAHGSATAVL